jgi:hypothetical protein
LVLAVSILCFGNPATLPAAGRRFLPKACRSYKTLSLKHIYSRLETGEEKLNSCAKVLHNRPSQDACGTSR